jgi:hypothetical protein
MTVSGGGWVELAVSGGSGDLDAIADLLGEYAPGAVWIEPAIETSDHDFAYAHGGAACACGGRHVVTEARAGLEAKLGALQLAQAARPARAPRGQHDWAEWKRFYRRA